MLAATLTLAALTVLLTLDDTLSDDNRQTVAVESDEHAPHSRR